MDKLVARNPLDFSLLSTSPEFLLYECKTSHTKSSFGLTLNLLFIASRIFGLSPPLKDSCLCSGERIRYNGYSILFVTYYSVCCYICAAVFVYCNASIVIVNKSVMSQKLHWREQSLDIVTRI